PAGKTLRVETLNSASIHWSADNWRTVHDTPTRDTLLSVHVADLPTDTLPPGAALEFTFHWTEAGRWEGMNFEIEVVASDAPRVEERVERRRGQEQMPGRRRT